MDIDLINNTKSSNMLVTPTFIWCLLMPSIHFFSLISNILCIIVFCSNTFIKKPIAIYFICLLISDSITLLIGYMEMIDRQRYIIEKNSYLCAFNEKIIHGLTDFIYTFMGNFCLEWMLYKVLWTRVSTILLAILSIQRTRTFFSLSYHETRLCAFLACIFSIIIAIFITCLEWIGVQYNKVNDVNIYYEIFQLVNEKTYSNEFYSNYLLRNLNESISNYTCLSEFYNLPTVSIQTNKTNCSSNNIGLEFYQLTKSLLANRDHQISETASIVLSNLSHSTYNLSNSSVLMKDIRLAETNDFIGRLFEKRSCFITINYSIWLKLYNFFHAVTFTFNRRAFAIFFGNALPSFIVVLANLLSIKVIYFSKSLKYLKQATRKNRRKRRLQNDLRAFLVIIIESFSLILISWGIPIFLTMYHCRTLYVIVMTSCPKINDYLALFLFTDLFNSSTNCLLYSLSGKLFRRKYLSILKALLTCGRGILWHRQENLSHPLHPPLARQLSNNPSVNTLNNNNFAKQSLSRAGSCRLSERLSSPLMNNQNIKSNNSIRTRMTTHKHTNGQNLNVSDDGSLSLCRISDDQIGGKYSSSELDCETRQKLKDIQSRKSSQSKSIRSYLMKKVRSLSTASAVNSKQSSRNPSTTILKLNKRKFKDKKKKYNSNLSKRQTTTDLSLSSSSFSRSFSYGSQIKQLSNPRCSTPKNILSNSPDTLSITDNNVHENLTSL